MAQKASIPVWECPKDLFEGKKIKSAKISTAKNKFGCDFCMSHCDPVLGQGAVDSLRHAKKLEKYIWITNLYLAGVPSDVIAKAFEITAPAVIKALHERKVPIRSHADSCIGNAKWRREHPAPSDIDGIIAPEPVKVVHYDLRPYVSLDMAQWLEDTALKRNIARWKIVENLILNSISAGWINNLNYTPLPEMVTKKYKVLHCYVTNELRTQLAEAAKLYNCSTGWLVHLILVQSWEDEKSSRKAERAIRKEQKRALAAAKSEE
jgi:hypothetical protein